MRPPLRIAVLECDTPLAQTKEQYGGYGAVFKALLKAGTKKLDQPEVISSEDGLDITYWDVVTAKQYPDPNDIDAILITGSRFDAFADNEWTNKLVDFTQKMLENQKVRIIGVCYGHQIVARAMGAKVGRSDKGWETSVSVVKMTEQGEELFGKDILSLHQMHRDVVQEWPEGVEHLGSTPVCEVQGIHVKGRVITVQGHPEFTEPIVREILESRHEQGLFDNDEYESAMERVGHSHDGVLVGQAFIKFLLDD